MDIFLNKEKLGYIKNVFSATLPQEETMEMIVPDAMPDIERIVDTDANVFLRSKSTDSGRIMVTGVADVTVLYCPEGEMGVRKWRLRSRLRLRRRKTRLRRPHASRRASPSQGQTRQWSIRAR